MDSSMRSNVSRMPSYGPPPPPVPAHAGPAAEPVVEQRVVSDVIASNSRRIVLDVTAPAEHYQSNVAGTSRMAHNGQYTRSSDLTMSSHPSFDASHQQSGLLDMGSKQMEYISDKHPKMLLHSLSILRRRDELCDVTIVVNERHIRAHKVLLAAFSPYFLAMFTGEMVESRKEEIRINDVDEKAMEMLIDFCYTAHIIIEESSVQVLLPAACLLQMSEIQEACCEFLKNELDPSNCLGIRAFADTHACQDLLCYADKFVHDAFKDVIENEEFQMLPIGQLIEIISCDQLNVSNEEIVYSAVMNWVRYDVGERRQYLSQILQHVRLSQLSPKFLIGTVCSDMLIKSDEPCRELVDEAKNYLILPQERSMMVGPRFKPRRPLRKREVLFAVGGWCSGDAISSVERYDGNDWKLMAPMSKPRCGVGCAVLNKYLYAVGGHDGASYLNTIERYDPWTNKWLNDVTPASTCRTSVGVAVMDDFLYAVGGQDGVSCLNVVERYSEASNKWQKLPNMITKRLGVAVAVLGGCLYAIGGSDGSNPLSSVERYDPRSNRWIEVAPMWTPRKHLGCATFNGMIYAVGGRDDTTELNTCERYSTETNIWQPIANLRSKRSGVGLAVVNGLLYAVGGFDGSNYLKSIEVYSPDTNTWSLCGSMNYRRLGGGVGVIQMS